MQQTRDYRTSRDPSRWACLGLTQETGKIATLAVNSLQKCSRGRFNTKNNTFGILIFYLRMWPWHQKFH